MTDFEDRLAALEAFIVDRKIELADLPLAPLQRKLESSWQPDAGTLLSPGTVTPEQMAQKISFGLATLTFTASTDSANLLVPHTCGRVPLAVVATSFNGPTFPQIPTPNTFTWTATDFTLNAELRAAYTGTIQVSWVALA